MENKMKTQTYDKKIRAAWRLYLEEVVEPNVMITFNFNDVRKRPNASMRELEADGTTTVLLAHRKMKDFFNYTQREAFGRDWDTQFHRLWPLAIGFLEHPNSNLHFHVNANLCPDMLAGVIDHGTRIWEDIQPGGSLCVQPTDHRGAKGQIIYSTKALLGVNAVNGVFEYKKTSPFKNPEDQLRDLKAAAVEVLLELKFRSAALPRLTHAGKAPVRRSVG